MLSRRTTWSAPTNRLTRAREAAVASGGELLDLTISNPTRAGIDYPAEALRDALAAGAAAPYDPEPFGLRSAREALAAELSTPDDPVSPDDLVLTASTSEAYAFLFKLFADPGTEIVTHRPSYPLLDHLAELEGVALRRFPLDFHGARWEVEPFAAGSSIGDRTRAVVVIHPNNPTGSYLRDHELTTLLSILAPRRIPLIADEVFFDYTLDPSARPSRCRSDGEALVLSLGGLSKSCGLPHWKLGWIRISGPDAARHDVLRGLELIADTYLSVATPVQASLGPILEAGREIRARITARVRENWTRLRDRFQPPSPISLLPAEGGWSAVLRVPLRESEEETAIALLERERVVVHPGYLFDFATEGLLVVSLLTPPDTLHDGLTRIERALV